jgi:predicted nucleic acid-binding protein
MPIVVSDTSPLRALAHLGLLDLLGTMFGEVYVPPGVIAELQIPRRRFPSLDLSAVTSIRVQAPADSELVTELMRGRVPSHRIGARTRGESTADGRSVRTD